MGLTCKPVGKFASILRKMENQLSKDKAAQKDRTDKKNKN